jgi:carbamoyl-phosphate synthase large subunit
MTGAGAPGAPGIIYCLRQEANIQLTVADASEEAAGRWLEDDFVKIPPGNDPGFIDFVLKICLEKKINLVLPLVTKELLAFSENKERFAANGIQILVSSANAIKISNNKSATHQFLKEKGIDLPSFSVVKTVEEFKKAAQQLGYPEKPFCMKPSVSNGSRGVRIVSENIDEQDLLFNQKPYQLHIGFDHIINILSQKSFPELLVSEYLPGPEFSVDCLANQGKTIIALPRLRKKMVNGISVQGEFVKDEAIISYCKQIIEAIGLHGNIGIQVKYDENNRPLLLEINPRVQGTIVAALGAGVNLPLLAVKQELQFPITEEELKTDWGTRFLRYWTEVYY